VGPPSAFLRRLEPGASGGPLIDLSCGRASSGSFLRFTIGQVVASTAIDLFAGAGGATQGLTDAGFSVLAAVESDGPASDSYRANHPGVHLVESDIRQVDPDTLRLKP
jgi:predicted RNA methylase